MPSFEYAIDEKERAGARFLGDVKEQLLFALSTEKQQRKLTQQAIADKLGVNRSVVNRWFMGLENVTAKTIGELLWALGWEPHFEVRKPIGANDISYLDRRLPPPRSDATSDTKQIEPLKKVVSG